MRLISTNIREESTEWLIAFLIWLRQQAAVTSSYCKHTVLSITVSVIASVVTFAFLSTVIITFSISIYSAFYYLYMPSHVYTIHDLNFLFTPCDVSVQNEKGYTKCSFPTATLDFRDVGNNHREGPNKQSYFLTNQSYTMTLHLNLAMPHQETYSRTFVICITLLDDNQDPVSFVETDTPKEGRCVSAMFFPKSVYAKFVDFLLRYPIQAVQNIFEQSSMSVGIAMATELNQWTKVTFLHEFMFSNYSSVVKAEIKIKDVAMDPIQATLHIHDSNLLLWKSPLLYLMTYHSNITGLIAVIAISVSTPILILKIIARSRFGGPTVPTRYSSHLSNNTDDLNLHYDQDRGRLQSANSSIEQRRHNPNPSDNNAFQRIIGEDQSHNLQLTTLNKENQECQINSSADANFSNLSSYVEKASDNELQEEEDLSKMYMGEIDSSKDDILKNVGIAKNGTNDAKCEIEDLIVQNDVKCPRPESSSPESCVQLTRDISDREPVFFS